MTHVPPLLVEHLGWAAMAVFTASYFFTRAQHLRAVQMVGATMWVGYGVATSARPVIAANLLVLAVATFTALRERLRGATIVSGSPGAPRS